MSDDRGLKQAHDIQNGLLHQIQDLESELAGLREELERAKGQKAMADAAFREQGKLLKAHVDRERAAREVAEVELETARRLAATAPSTEAWVEARQRAEKAETSLEAARQALAQCNSIAFIDNPNSDEERSYEKLSAIYRLAGQRSNEARFALRDNRGEDD